MEATLQTREQIEQITDVNKRAILRCQTAKNLEELNEYEAARAAMGELWQRVGEKPNVNNLDYKTKAEVTLRAGALTLWLGQAHQVSGAQELARDLLFESMLCFEELNEPRKVHEAQIAIGSTYFSEGAYDEARVMLSESLSKLDDSDGDLKIIASIRLVNTQHLLGLIHDAYKVIEEIRPIVDKISDLNLKGRFYNTLALTQRKLAASEDRKNLIDEALLNYAAASVYLEQAGNRAIRAMVENNLGFLLFKENRFSEAENHLKISRKLFKDLRNEHYVAYVDETRATLLLAEGRPKQAELMAKGAVNTLEKGGPQGRLAEALTTHATALARLDRQAQAHLTFTRAIDVAGQVGDTTGAGRAALSAFEELAANLDRTTLLNYYNTANDFLRGERADVEMETFQRLTRCAKYLSHLDRERTKSKYAMGGASYVPTENGVSYDFYPDLEIRSDLVPYTAVAATSLFNVDDLSPFARLEGRVIHDRYGKYIAMLDEDLTTLRCPYTERVIAKKEDGRFIRPDGDIWALLERPVNVHANFLTMRSTSTLR